MYRHTLGASLSCLKIRFSTTNLCVYFRCSSSQGNVFCHGQFQFLWAKLWLPCLLGLIRPDLNPVSMVYKEQKLYFSPWTGRQSVAMLTSQVLLGFRYTRTSWSNWKWNVMLRSIVSHSPYLLSSETTPKGMGLDGSTGKEDPVELDSYNSQEKFS